MKLGHCQELRLSHRLAMTPRLQQAIRLLQLSHLDLAEFVAREVEENPLLEQELADPFPVVQRTAEAEDWLQQVAQPAPDLQGYLLLQLGQMSFSPVELRRAAGLVAALDPDGYLRVELEDLAEELECRAADLEALLRKLQQLEPTGVFARDLRECLALQLAERGRLDPAMTLLLDNLPLLARQAWSELAGICRVDVESLRAMAQEVRALDPRPGADIAPDLPGTLVPDLLVSSGESGWQVELGAGSLPRVRVDHAGWRRLAGCCRSEEERAYLADRLEKARWLERALRRRAQTLKRVGEALLVHQEAFFSLGVAALRPLTRRELAEAVGIHESTVSRAIANKYLASPRGIHELRFFFSSRIPGGEGEFRSAQSIRYRIRELVQGESPQAVLSDEDIVSRLAGDGIRLARRTVAKYRSSLQIPSSSQRRRNHWPAG